MTDISIFADKLCDTTEYFDDDFEKNICCYSSKILKYFLNNDAIFPNSCLYNENYNSVVVNIVLCDDEKIHEINRDYRNVDRPTDVISFALYADSEPSERFVFDGEINLGDIFLSLETTKRQASENNVSFEHEFYYLISHSILHLLGFDHQDDMSYDFMVKMQNEVLSHINV